MASISNERRALSRRLRLCGACLGLLLLGAIPAHGAEPQRQLDWEEKYFETLSRFPSAPNDVVREEIVRSLETHGKTLQQKLEGWTGTLEKFRTNEAGDAVAGEVVLADPCGGTPHRIRFFAPIAKLKPELWARRESLEEGILVELHGRVEALDLERNPAYVEPRPQESTTRSPAPTPAPEAAPMPPPAKVETTAQAATAGAAGVEDVPPTAGASGTASLLGFLDTMGKAGFKVRQFFTRTPKEEKPPESPAEMSVKSIVAATSRSAPPPVRRPSDLADDIIARNPQFAARIPQALLVYVSLEDLSPFDPATRHAEDLATVSKLAERITTTADGPLISLQEKMPALQASLTCDGLLEAAQSPECIEAPLRAKNLGFTCPGPKGQLTSPEALSSRRAFLAAELTGISRAVRECRFERDYAAALAKTTGEIGEFIDDMSRKQADSAYLAACLPEKPVDPGPSLTTQPIRPPQDLDWGMTYDEIVARWGKTKLRDGWASRALAHQVERRSNVAGEQGKVYVGLDSRNRVVSTSWLPEFMGYPGVTASTFTPIKTRSSDPAIARELANDEQRRLTTVLRLENFWTNTVTGITEKYGPPYSTSAQPHPLEPGEKLSTIWLDSAGNDIELLFERDIHGGYWLWLHYRSQEYIETLKNKNSGAF